MTGHSLLFAIGATILLLPYVATFEWSKDSIKFSTRDEVAVLARNAVAATRDEVQLRTQIAELAGGLKSAILRINALEASAGAEAPEESAIIDGWTPMALDSWLRANEDAKAEAEHRIDMLQDLETKLMREPPLQ